MKLVGSQPGPWGDSCLVSSRCAGSVGAAPLAPHSRARVRGHVGLLTLALLCSRVRQLAGACRQWSWRHGMVLVDAQADSGHGTAEGSKHCMQHLAPCGPPNP